MSDSPQTKQLTVEPSAAGSQLEVASNHCWPSNSIAPNEYFLFNIDVSGANIVGAGIHTHGYERVTVTSNYPQSGSNWQLVVYNWEDHPVTFDVYAWWD